MRLLPQVLELGFMEFNLYLESIMTRKIIDQILSIWHAGEGGAKGVCAFLPLPKSNKPCMYNEQYSLWQVNTILSEC